MATFKSLLVHASRLNAANRFSYSSFSAGLRQRTLKAAEFRYLSANAASSRSECRYRSFIAAECRQHPRNTAQFRSLPLNAEGCRWSPLNSARRVRYRSFPLGNGPSGPRYFSFFEREQAVAHTRCAASFDLQWQ